MGGFPVKKAEGIRTGAGKKRKKTKNAQMKKNGFAFMKQDSFFHRAGQPAARGSAGADALKTDEEDV